MSKDYSFEIGYEALWKEWEIQKKRTPRGVTLVKGGSNIYLQFKTPNTTRSKYKCSCTFSIDGMHEAVRKSHLVKTKLTNLSSEVEFWEWYKGEIEEESQLVDDRLTFGEAIAKVENDFWSRPSRTGRERDRNNASDQASWHRTYGCFYERLPEGNAVALGDIQKVIDKQGKGTRNYKYAVSAMKKLTRVIKRQDILNSLDDLNVVQTKFATLQSINLDEFLAWRNKTLGITKALSEKDDLNARKAWMWAFSVQIVYALRISEVFAIKNLTKTCKLKDGVIIPALNDPDNTTNLIYIGDKTVIGTTVKTGARIARPQIPPKYPDLIERLAIKNPLLPTNRPKSKKPKSIADFFCSTARKKLILWDAPFSQTHADRNLGNVNGMQAGIPQEIRSKSMGHTPAQNESGYKKRMGTQTTIDLLLNSNQNAIDFVTALAETKKLLKSDPESKKFASKILSIIYQKNVDEISELL